MKFYNIIAIIGLINCSNSSAKDIKTLAQLGTESEKSHRIHKHDHDAVDHEIKKARHILGRSSVTTDMVKSTAAAVLNAKLDNKKEDLHN